jgi:branched-chain amino acid aminotransferase
MAKFEGIQWAGKQMRYTLDTRQFDMLAADAPVFAVSKSVQYGAFQAFEGIRFFCRHTAQGGIEAAFLNWDKNLERFRRGIAFNLGSDQQHLVPGARELEEIFIRKFFSAPGMRPFFAEMADLGAQGYLRPFTVDEELSIGVAFPAGPAIRAVICRYDRYLGEPFTGVVIPHMVRALGINRTGCLKLGINYVMSVKAVDEAKKISPDAASALFLDDQPQIGIEDRNITEWDSSCCLFGLRDGTVVKIPESNLILPSITIFGITTILRSMGVRVEERHVRYGELLAKSESGELIAACSVGTAGILNRCQKLILVDQDLNPVAEHRPDESHPLYHQLREAREYYWKIYKEEVPPPAGMKLFKYAL